MSDRIFAAIMLVFSVYYGWEAYRLKVNFTYDPLGAKAFPIFLSAILAILSLLLLVRPGQRVDWPRGRLLQKGFLLVATLAVYAITLPWLGFILSTMLMAFITARLFYATWGQSTIAGFIFGFGFYGLFGWLLHIPLPSGQILGV